MKASENKAKDTETDPQREKDYAELGKLSLEMGKMQAVFARLQKRANELGAKLNG